MAVLGALETLAIDQPTFATEIASILQKVFRPEYTEPLTAADLATPAEILQKEWDPTHNWDSADRLGNQYRFHAQVKAVLEKLSAPASPKR